jgi:hypothetical protein
MQRSLEEAKAMSVDGVVSLVPSIGYVPGNVGEIVLGKRKT